MCVAQKDSCLILINTQSLNFNHLKMIKRQKKKKKEKEGKSDFRLKALPKFSLGQILILNVNKLLEMRSPFFCFQHLIMKLHSGRAIPLLFTFTL